MRLVLIRYIYLIVFSLFSLQFIACSSSSTNKNTIADISTDDIENIEISPLPTNIPLGTSIQLEVTAIYQSGKKALTTNDILWSSSDSSIFTVSKNGNLTAIASGTAGVNVMLKNFDDTVKVTVNAAALIQLSISPIISDVNQNTDFYLSVFALYDDDSKLDVTQFVNWQSDSSDIVNYTGDNQFRALKAGSSNVTANYRSLSSERTIIVNQSVLTSIQIEFQSDQIYQGDTVEYRAFGIFNNGKKQNITQSVIWTIAGDIDQDSLDQTQITAKSAGEIIVKANYLGIEATKVWAISIATLDKIEIITPRDAVIAGETGLLKAIGHFSNNKTLEITQSVNWSSSDLTVANISNSLNFAGQVQALQFGESVITATLDNVSSQKSIQISAAILSGIDITIEQNTLALGNQLKLTAIGTYSDQSTRDITLRVSWFSEDEAILHISNDTQYSGLMTALTIGNSKIRAEYMSFNSQIEMTVSDAALVSISIDQVNTQLNVGVAALISAIGIFSDGTQLDITQAVLWQSSNSAIASISNATGNEGQLSAVASGNIQISATLNNLINIVTLQINQATAISIEILSSQNSFAVGSQLQLQANILYSDGNIIDVTSLVDWQSNDDETVESLNRNSDKGLVIAIKTGVAEINATYDNITAKINIQVTDATLTSIEITPGDANTIINSALSLIATGIYSDGSKQNITNNVLWQVNDNALASISNSTSSEGTLFALMIGEVNVSASFENITSNRVVRISDATLSSISILPNDIQSIVENTQITLSALGNYSDGSTRDISNQVTWQTANNEICIISTSDKFYGQLTTLAEGTCAISATKSNISSSIIISVSSATLQSIVISPAQATIAKGSQLNLRAIGHFSDNTELDLTTNIIWNTSADNITISNYDGQQGLIKTIDSGEAEITASYQTVIATTTVTISPAELESIVISTISTSSFVLNSRRVYTAIGIYSDQSQQDISKEVLWVLENSDLANVDNSIVSPGNVTALIAGQTQLTAKLGNIESNVITLTLANDPTAPIAISLNASPYVILNNATDSAQISIFLRASDPYQKVVDNTVIDLEVIDGVAQLNSSTVISLNGEANFSISSDTKGVIVVKATVSDTDISRLISIYVTDSFAEVIARSGFVVGALDNDQVAIGSKFGFVLINFSNRDFVINAYQVTSNEQTIFSTSTPEELNNGLLVKHESIISVFETTQLRDNSMVIIYYLSEAVTGHQFSISIAYQLQPTP